jgi:AmmeMemoRadiSam system protein A
MSSVHDAYTPDQQQRILTIARHAIAASLRGHAYAEEPAANEMYLVDPRGCFVTLSGADGALRGCIGTFDDKRPLIDNLIDMAGASTRDPRFVAEPVTMEEMDRIRVEVSVLTPMEPMDDPTKLVVGEEGVYIVGKLGGQRVGGCFLPEVAADQGWDAETALSMCCAHKMGLDPDAWRPPTRLQFFRFRSLKIRE